MRTFCGNVWAFEDNVDTDVIIPARYLTTHAPEELGRHCMEDLDPYFPSKVQRGDMLVAGENFGCGSSREHAPLAILGCGVSCVVASSFARIFYRNAINVGLPIVEIADARSFASTGDLLEVDLPSGTLRNLTTGQVRHAPPLSGIAGEIVSSGGLVNYVRRQLGVTNR
jgi:3-isopropylmalate dehydratase small subunit